MEFVDLRAQYAALKDEIDDAIQRVLDHGRFIMGPEVSELEKRLAEYVGVRHCITCANGTDALLLPLMAWGVGPGDAVFVPTFTFFATAEVVSLVGATPVFVDIDARTFNLDPDQLESAIQRIENSGELVPKVVIPVDLFGLPADYSGIEAIARRHNLLVLEDGAQGFGGSCHGQKACSFGHAATTSFFPAKPLGCYGDGGAILTNDDELASSLRSLRVHGQGTSKYDNVRIGLNSRLDTIQAAILLPKLRAFEEYELDRREWLAQTYSNALSGSVNTPSVPDGYRSSWAQYSVLASSSEERTRMQEALKSAGVPTMVYYVKPLHLQSAYRDLGYAEGDMPIAEDVCRRIFSLPMHPYLAPSAVDEIATVLRSAKTG